MHLFLHKLFRIVFKKNILEIQSESKSKTQKIATEINTMVSLTSYTLVKIRKISILADIALDIKTHW